MFTCYDQSCETQVEEQYTYCDPCKEKHYPSGSSRLQRSLMNLKKSLDKKELNPPALPSESKLPNISQMNFTDLKAYEKKASEWMVLHKHLAKQNDPQWLLAKKRYDYIVRLLNIRSTTTRSERKELQAFAPFL